MIAKTNFASVLGIDAHPVDVEVDVSIGLSTFDIVGLPNGTIKESRDRVTAAVTNSGFNFPSPGDIAENRIGIRPSHRPGPVGGASLFS